MSWWEALFLEATMPLRFVLLPLALANLAWSTALSFYAVWRGDDALWPNASFAIPIVLFSLGTAGFNHGYLVEGVPMSGHWRDGLNLMPFALGHASLLLLFAFRLREILRASG